MKSNRIFFRFSRACATALLAAVAVTACNRGNDNALNFPDGFQSLTDEKKVDYMMKNVAPDSVARFIICASLGDIPGVTIDAINMATLYAYENYHGDDLNTFSAEYDDYPNRQTIDRKMHIYKLVGQHDPMQLGYALGLEYADQIRQDHKTPQEVDEEMEALKKACMPDSDLYERVRLGFKTVLISDKGRDIPKSIYEKYTR